MPYPQIRSSQTATMPTACSPAYGPLRVCFDASCGASLRQVLISAGSLFVESDAAAADVVIFGSDEIAYIDASALHRAFAHKAICITESDIPTFRLRGLYAANQNSWVTGARTRTVNYFISDRDRGNREIRRLAERYAAGQPLEKRYLYSFMGGSNSWPRKRLFRHVASQGDTLIEATDSYNHWTEDHSSPEQKANHQRRYASVMAASRFALCPRGCGLSSYRLFESMSLGVAPVIISDRWRPVEGIDWSFALFVPERHIRDIDRIVRSHAVEWEDRGRAGQVIFTRHFSPGAVAATLHRQIVALAPEHSPAREAAMAIATRARAAQREVYWALYGCLKQMVLRACYLSGLSVPVHLHEPIEQQLNRAAPSANTS